MRRVAAFVMVVFSFCACTCSSAMSAPTEVGDRAAAFKAVDVDGNSVDFKSYLNKSAVMLVFFATWCPPCRKEVPHLIDIENEYSERGLKVLAVSVDSSRKVLPPFIKKNGINYTVWQGNEGASLYNVVGIPTNILINKEGQIVYRGHRPPSGKEIEKVLQS